MKKALIALTIAGVLGATLTVISAPAAHADGLQKCADYEFVALRGSGEKSSDIDSSNGYDGRYDGAGQTLDAAYKALNKQLTHMGYTSALDAVNYRAVALKAVEEFEGATTNIGPYTSSVGDGVEKLTQAIGTVQETCPDSKIILGGYSQGAQVVDETLNMKTQGFYDSYNAETYVLWENAHYTPISSSTANSIAGVLLFGDPKFNGTDDTVDNSTYDPAHSGVWLLHQKWSTGLDYASTKVVSYCHLADPVCNSREDEVSDGVHHTVADLAWVLGMQLAAGDAPFHNKLGLPHTTYYQDAYQSVDQLLANMGLPVVSSRTLGADDDQPGDTAYLVDSRADMWQDDPTNHNHAESAFGDDDVTYMDEVAAAINAQIMQQAERDDGERWMLAMYQAAPDALPDTVKEPFTGYYNYPEYDTMSNQDVGDTVPSQIWGLEEQSGGPAASGLDGFSLDSSDYSDPTTLNRQLLQTANIFAAVSGSNDYVWPRLGYSTGVMPGHRERIVIVTDHPDDLTRSMQVTTTPGQQPETWSLASSISYLEQLGVSISFWNPIADPTTDSANSSFTTRVGADASPAAETASAVKSQSAGDTGDSPSSADIAAATHGTVVDTADGLNDIDAYAAQQPVDQIDAPLSSYTGEPVSASSANTEGDGLDPIDHTDWTVTGPDGASVDTETTNGGGPLHFTPSTAGPYTIRSTITLQSGFSGDASWTDTVTDAPTDVPAVPAVTASVDDGNNVTLTWPASPGATYYTVYDGDGNVLDRINPLTDANGNPTWTQSLPDQTGDVGYTISASDDIGESPQSATATVTLHTLVPDVPTVTGAVAADNTVTLTWPAETRATSYTVYDADLNVLGQVAANANTDADGNETWTQAFADKSGNTSFTVSATDDGGESAQSDPVQLFLHDLTPAVANVADATGDPSYSGALSDAGVPEDQDPSLTSDIQDECTAAGSSVSPQPIALSNGPFRLQSVQAVGDHSIVVDLTATNQQLCDLYDDAELPSSEFQNAQLSVDGSNGFPTMLVDNDTGAPITPQSAYLSVGAATDGLATTRTLSVLLNFDSSFNASDQAQELQSELDSGALTWGVLLAIGQEAWAFQDLGQNGGGGGGGGTPS